jgi:hypothetical protein
VDLISLWTQYQRRITQVLLKKVSALKFHNKAKLIIEEVVEGAGEDVEMEKGGLGVVQEGEDSLPCLILLTEGALEEKEENVPPVPPEGSSRVTGGVLRGRAVGNVLNLPDTSELIQDIPVPAKGTVRLYSDLSHQPSTHQPILTMKTDAKPTLGPILQKLARSYSPVRSKYLWCHLSFLISL